MFLWQLLQSLYLVKPSWLRYCCAVQKEVTGTSPAGSPTPAPRTDPAPFLSPRGPSARPARGCWPRGGCKSPGERAAPCSQPVPSPPPAGGHRGTGRPCPSVTLHLGEALERSGAAPAVPWPLPLLPGPYKYPRHRRARYKYPGHRRARYKYPGHRRPSRGAGRWARHGCLSVPDPGAVAVAARASALVSLPLKPEPVPQSPAGAARLPCRQAALSGARPARCPQPRPGSFH